MADDDSVPSPSSHQPVASTAKDEKENATRTFFTSIDASGVDAKKKEQEARFRALEGTAAGPRIVEHHQDLTTLALSLDRRMAALLTEHEKDFFLAYKTHMYTVQKDIKTLRVKADSEEAKTREDSKIKALEGELDWFMTEALRLDELCKGYKQEVDKWKSKAHGLDEDRRFLEEQILGSKRQNKILRAAAERARSSAYSALMATKAAEGDAPTPAQPNLAPEANSSFQVTWRPLSGSLRVGSKKMLEARSKTPELAGPRAVRLLPSDADPMVTRTGPHVGTSEVEERYIEAIAHLKDSIAREQQNVRMLQAVRATQYSKKSELEEFFLKCIDDSRKDLLRRRHLTMYRDKSEKERVLEAMLNSEDVLVCLYEKLFPHRAGIARSLGAPPALEDTAAT